MNNSPKKPKIILASSSPRRKMLLEQLKLKFNIITSDFPEEEIMKMEEDPIKLVEKLSYGKAMSVLEKYLTTESKDQPAVIIGADTVGVFKDKIASKPKDENEAFEILKRASGNVVNIITGFTLVHTERMHPYFDHSLTKVFFRHITDKEIKAYIATGEPIDKAGAFAIQGIGTVFIEKIEGDMNNVIGLPIFKLALGLKEFGVEIL